MHPQAKGLLVCHFGLLRDKMYQSCATSCILEQVVVRANKIVNIRVKSSVVAACEALGNSSKVANCENSSYLYIFQH